MKRRRFALYTLVTGSIGGLAYNWRGDIVFDPTRSKPRGSPAKVVVNNNKKYSENKKLKNSGIEEMEEAGIAALPEVTKYVIKQRTNRSKLELTCGVKSLLFGPVVAISYDKAYDENGVLVGEPSISFEDLRKKTPKKVTLEIKGKDKRTKAQLPVSISKGTVMQQ